MQIEQIHIENFGRIKYLDIKFDSEINFISSEYWCEILAVLGLVTASGIVGFNFTRYVFTQNTHVYAVLTGNFGLAEVELFYDKGRHCGCAEKITLNDEQSSFKELRKAVGASFEEEECAIFFNKYDYMRHVPFSEYDFISKIGDYLKPSFKGGREEIIQTRQFEEILLDFISSFKSVLISSSRDIWLSITKEGVFIPLCNGEEVSNLSSFEWSIFYCLCFVKVNEFWGRVAQKFNFKEQLPMFICGSAVPAGRPADVRTLTELVSSLCRQTFFLGFCGKHTKVHKST